MQTTAPEEQPHTVGFYAGDVTTRTEMLEDGLSAVWVIGDKISLWAKNSAGNFALANQQFTTYGLEGPLGYFTSTLSSPMQEGTYTYYSCYPAPATVNGTRVTFPLPAVQDGKAGGGTDIMISIPAEGPELTSISDEGVHNDISLTMHRMTHQFRFWIPRGENKLGEPIRKIELTFPRNVVGTFWADLTKPTTYTDVANGSKTVILELDEPLDESDFETAQFAYAVVAPINFQYSTDYSDRMEITVYGNSSKSVLESIPLAGRNFQSGHSTPVRLLPQSPAVHCSLKIRTGINNIGEPLWNIKISSDGTTLFSYANTSSAYHNIEYTQEYQGQSGKNTFDKIINAIRSGNAVLNYETAHTSVDIRMTADMMSLNGNAAVLNLGDVPYLLYEDFSSAKSYAMNDGYSGSSNSETGTSGYLLNNYLYTPGWNAARFGLIEEDCVRINCRAEGAVGAVARYCGRLDTPALKYIKDGHSVDVVVEYDKAFYIPVGYNCDDSNSKMAYYRVGKHTNSESSTLGGFNSVVSNPPVEVVYTSDTYNTENVGNMEHVKLTVPSMGQSSRLSFIVDSKRGSTDFLGNNACYYLYLDNIKVYLKSN